MIAKLLHCYIARLSAYKLQRPERPRYHPSSLHERVEYSQSSQVCVRSRIHSWIISPWCSASEYKKQFNNSTIRQFSFGFTLIELLIVISLFGLATGLVTTSYLTFERRERVKNAALGLKNNIRLAQNRAHTGFKGFEDANRCDTVAGDRLIGWFITISPDLSTYKIAGDCLVSGEEVKFAQETFSFPKDVKVASVNSGSEVNILYRPLTSDVSFHGPMSMVDFLDSSANLKNELFQSEIIVSLKGPTVRTYEVKILKSGEVNEKKL